MFISDPKPCNEFIPQPHGQKSGGRQTQCFSTLCKYLCTWPIWCCSMEPFYMRYLVVHFDQKSCYLLICSVPTTLANQFFFCNHRNRKVVGDKHNVLIHFSKANAPEPSGVVSCNTFKWDILWFILIKNLVILCVEQQQNEFYSSFTGTEKW